MRVISIIEIVDNNVQGIDSFSIVDEQLSKEVVEEAEALFKAKARENDCLLNDRELDVCIEDGYWELNDYAVNITWSVVDS